MPSWIAFDDDTASILRSRLPEQTILELPAQSAMEHALNGGEATVAVLPCPGLGQAALAVFRWTRIPPPLSASSHQADVRAGGFLGLTDESVFEEESEEKRSWWKRFWEG
jgi:hypothetical protein